MVYMKLLMDYRGKYTISCVHIALSYSGQNDVNIQHSYELLQKCKQNRVNLLAC